VDRDKPVLHRSLSLEKIVAQVCEINICKLTFDAL
jgi:hypothetical protein